MGFVRVGAVMLDEANQKNSAIPAEDEYAAAGDEMEGSNPFVTSDVMSYKVVNGETLTRIAAKFEVDVWDIIFLNKHSLGEAVPSSKPKVNALLLIPAKNETTNATAQNRQTIQTSWYVAKNNDTPRIIAKHLNISCQDIVNGNKAHLPGLISNSRLKEGTRVKVSNFDCPENIYSAYAHWSFPNAEYEEPEPSYMMALKINRRKGSERNHRPFEMSLKTQIKPYEPTQLLLPPSPQRAMNAPAVAAALPSKSSVRGKIKPPKRPLSAYKLFASENRDAGISGKFTSESAKETKDRWNELSANAKAQYESRAIAALQKYHEQMAKYCDETSTQLNTNHETTCSMEGSTPLCMSEDDAAFKLSLYNKVVRLKPDAMTEGSEYTYW